MDIIVQLYYIGKILEEKFMILWINMKMNLQIKLEFIVKNADFTQDIFIGKILDYNTYCKEKIRRIT